MSESTSTLPAPAQEISTAEANRIARRTRKKATATEFPLKPTRFVDTAKPYVDVPLRGRTIRVARFTWREVEDLEERQPGGLPGFIGDFALRPFKNCHELLYLATRRTHEELTEDDCGDLLPTSVTKLMDLTDTLLFATGLLERPEEGNALGAEAETDAPTIGSSSSDV